MAIPVKYRKSPEFIATYDWVDVANGLGFIRFYLVTAHNPSVNYVLTDQGTDYWPSEIEVGGSTTTQGSVATIQDVRFILSQFNSQRIIDGTAKIQFGFDYNGTGAGMEVYVDFYLYHYDGTTETQIGTVSALSDTNDAVGAEDSRVSTMAVTRTIFKKGDVLRFRALLRAESADGNPQKIWIGADPQNRDGTNITPSTTDATTRSWVDVPFEIDQ